MPEIENTAVTAVRERYYEKVSYPLLLMKLLSRIAGLLSKPPMRGSQDTLTVVAAADTAETIYYSLPSQLRAAVNARLRSEYRRLYHNVVECVKALEEGVLKLKTRTTSASPLVPRLALLREHRAGMAGLPLFLWRQVQYIVGEDGSIVGAVVLDPTPCAEGCDPNTLVKAFAMIARGEALAPQQQKLLRVCVAGLRMRTLATLRVIIDTLNEAGLLLEKGVVWIGQA